MIRALADWRPGASLDHLRKRAQMFATVRTFFAERGVLEVDTPVLAGATATDPHLSSIEADTGLGRAFLQTSPEFAMKRLLAAGSGPIYQLGKCFRAGECGDRHNPEFTLLEWYRPNFSLEQLKQECLALIEAVIGKRRLIETDYAALFESVLGVNPHSASSAVLVQRAQAVGFGDGVARWERDELIDLLFSHCVEPSLASESMVLVRDYPAHSAALARIRTDQHGHPVADRFELYINGLEIANAYHELVDANELRERMQVDNRARSASGKPTMPIDERLLAAMSAGLPPCSGIALGVDRLMMVALEVNQIDQVIAFSHPRVQGAE